MEAHAHWARTHTMLLGESITYFALLFATTGLLFWFYLRDAKRARSLQAFFASLTHELRTPLTSIRLQAESISESLPAQADQKELVQRLMEDSQRLEQQVERILELARVEGGGKIFTQPIAVHPWLDRIVREWKAHQGASEEIRVKLDLPDTEGVQILADQVAIQVIFKNLLENSVRHSKRSPLEIQIQSQQRGDGLCLVFRDNGHGFHGKSKDLGKLFEKGAGSQGAGVGLYLVRTLMERMGGSARFGTGNSGFEVDLLFPAVQEGGANG